MIQSQDWRSLKFVQSCAKNIQNCEITLYGAVLVPCSVLV